MRRPLVIAVILGALLVGVMLAVRSGEEGTPRDSSSGREGTNRVEVEKETPDDERGVERSAGARSRRLEREVAAAERRVASLTAEIAEIRAAGETVEHLVQRCKNGGFDCPAGEVSQKLLEKWAECGTLRIRGMAWAVGDDDAARLHVTEDERRRIREIGSAIQQADDAREAEIAAETTGEEAPPQPPGIRIINANSHAIRDATLDPEGIRRKLAREAAGLQDPPDDPDSGPPYERILRMKQSRARRFLEALEHELGAERVRELEDVIAPPGRPGGGTCPEP